MKQITTIMVLLLVACQTHAGKVVPEKLEDMISSVTVIAVATVHTAEKVNGQNCYRYTIEATNVLVGKLPAKRLTVNFWEQGSPHWSIVVPASGIENDLKEGRLYVMLFESGKVQRSLGVVLTRAEPEERLEAVLTAWRERKKNDKSGR
jgi:hypothetical protein